MSENHEEMEAKVFDQSLSVEDLDAAAGGLSYDEAARDEEPRKRKPHDTNCSVSVEYLECHDMLYSS